MVWKQFGTAAESTLVLIAPRGSGYTGNRQTMVKQDLGFVGRDHKTTTVVPDGWALIRSTSQCNAQQEVMREWKPTYFIEHPTVVARRPPDAMPADLVSELLRLWTHCLSPSTTFLRDVIECWPSWPLFEKTPIVDDTEPIGTPVSMVNGRLSWDDFYECAQRGFMCAEWAKMDRKGSVHPDPSVETELDNARGVFDLTYPHPVILAVMAFLCAQRCESVRDVDFCCRWLAILLPSNDTSILTSSTLASDKFDHKSVVPLGQMILASSTTLPPEKGDNKSGQTVVPLGKVVIAPTPAEFQTYPTTFPIEFCVAVDDTSVRISPSSTNVATASLSL